MKRKVLVSRRHCSMEKLEKCEDPPTAPPPPQNTLQASRPVIIQFSWPFGNVKVLVRAQQGNFNSSSGSQKTGGRPGWGWGGVKRGG